MQSSVATNLHIFSILFYNKSQKWKILATLGLFLMHAVRLHCWVHTKECRFFTLLDWFDCIFAVPDGNFTFVNVSQLFYYDDDEYFLYKGLVFFPGALLSFSGSRDKNFFSPREFFLWGNLCFSLSKLIPNIRKLHFTLNTDHIL